MDGRLFLVFSEDYLVGMSNFTPTIDGGGWLSMARTDPDWRGKGVAQFLQRSMATYALKNSIHILRFWVLSSNYASLRAAKKGNFKPVADAAHVSLYDKLPRRSKATDPFASLEKKQLASTILSQSRYVQKMNGYFAYWWYFVKGNYRVLQALCESNELLVSPEGVLAVFGRPRRDYGGLRSEFSLLEGPTRSVLELILEKAKSLRIDALGGYLPFDGYILKIAENMGFKIDSWGKHAILFEKRIP
jgi:hypothetical protein